MLQIGALAVILAAATYRTFELDRFFVPKELVLHATVLAAALLVLPSLRRMRVALVDLLLAGYLLLGTVSALLATNGWLATRALAISASGIVLFWVARALSERGLERPIVAAVGAAVVVGCATSLAQAYGLRTDFFSLNRAPGGTLGNRNFIAHMAAFGLPLVMLIALRARHWLHYALAAAGAALVVATLILTRSRAGFLAFAAVLVIFAAAPVLSRALRAHRATWLRLAGLVVLAAAAVAAAIVTPNELRWRSDNPYLESITGVANFQEGSGRGRLVQYRRSIVMAVKHPLLGVGPGNWAVHYPEHAAPQDPSLDRQEPGTTSNPWPSSDWVAVLAERGLPASLLLAFAMFGMIVAGLRRVTESNDPHDVLGATALLAMLAAAAVAGTFDAVLLLALPTLLVWSALGALWPPPAREVVVADVPRTAALVLIVMLVGIGALRSTAQLATMAVYEHADRATTLARAAIMDPANYRLRMRLARAGSGLDRDARCTHARTAHDLLPNARAARDLSRRCD